MALMAYWGDLGKRSKGQDERGCWQLVLLMAKSWSLLWFQEYFQLTLCCVCPDWQTLCCIFGIWGNPPTFHETPCKRLSLFHLRRPVWAWCPHSPAPNFLSWQSIWARRDRNAGKCLLLGLAVTFISLEYRSPKHLLCQLQYGNADKTTLHMRCCDECLFRISFNYWCGWTHFCRRL